MNVKVQIYKNYKRRMKSVYRVRSVDAFIILVEQKKILFI